MKININSVVSDMLEAMKRALDGNWDSVKYTAQLFLERDKERFKFIAELRISGAIPEVTFKARLDDEKFIIEAELNALEVVSRSIAQKAANAAIEAFKTAVSLALL